MGVTQVTWQSTKTLQLIGGGATAGDTGVVLKADILTFSDPGVGQDVVAD